MSEEDAERPMIILRYVENAVLKDDDTVPAAYVDGMLNLFLCGIAIQRYGPSVSW